MDKLRGRRYGVLGWSVSVSVSFCLSDSFSFAFVLPLTCGVPPSIPASGFVLPFAFSPLPFLLCSPCKGSPVGTPGAGSPHGATLTRPGGGMGAGTWGLLDRGWGRQMKIVRGESQRRGKRGGKEIWKIANELGKKESVGSLFCNSTCEGGISPVQAPLAQLTGQGSVQKNQGSAHHKANTLPRGLGWPARPWIGFRLERCGHSVSSVFLGGGVVNVVLCLSVTSSSMPARSNMARRIVARG